MKTDAIGQLVRKSIAAGVMIAAGCIVNIKLGGVAGAVLFSAGLVSVIALRLSLYTGQIGYISSWRQAPALALTLSLNLWVAWLCGALHLLISGTPYDVAARIGTLPGEFWQAVLCGALMYAAVEGCRALHSLTPAVLCVAVFVASGAEHCVADAFYAGASTGGIQCVIWLAVVVVGNTVGAVGLRMLAREKV